MKPIILLLISTLFISNLCDAQYQTKRRYNRTGNKADVKYGIRAGIQTTNFAGDEFLVEYDSDNLLIYPPVTYESRIGYQGGAYIDIRIKEGLIIQPEIQYTMMGTKMTRKADLMNPEQNFIVTPGSSPSDIRNVTINKRLNYVHVPLILKIGLNRLTHINVGPQLGFLISESNLYEDVDNEVITTVQFTNPNAPSIFRTVDIGAIMGLSYQFPNGLVANARYNINFNNVLKNESLPLLTEEPRITNTALMFSLGYTFLYRNRLKFSPVSKN